MNEFIYTLTIELFLKNPFFWIFIILTFLSTIFYKKIIGKAVEEVLMYLVNNNLIDNNYKILSGFPHPSGANGHRKEVFEKNKDTLISIINNM